MPVVGTIFDREPDPVSGEPGQIDSDIKPLIVGHRPGPDDLVGQDLTVGHDSQLPVPVRMMTDSHAQSCLLAPGDLQFTDEAAGCLAIQGMCLMKIECLIFRYSWLVQNHRRLLQCLVLNLLLGLQSVLLKGPPHQNYPCVIKPH